MKSSILSILGLFMLTSCGIFQWLGHTPSEKEREMASVSVQHLMAEDDQTFNEEVLQKLSYLHNYYVMAQNLMLDLDKSEASTSSLYQSETYLKLLAVRTQVEEIEHELHDVWNLGDASTSGLKRRKLLTSMVIKFASESKMSAASMENLGMSFGIEDRVAQKDALPAESIRAELQKLEQNKEFMLFEKNIDHLAHVMETRMDTSSGEISPNPGKSGHITGDEFPSKVWSLSFDDGPTKTTLEILKVLQEKNIQATFFQIASRVEAYPTEAKNVLKFQMELGAHSWNHLQLTKVGGTTLHKEIALATKRIEEIQKSPVKFYRLPYGAGVSVNRIREKIAEAGLIHVGWNVDGLDWIPQTSDKIVARTLKLMGKTNKDAGIILLHDVHPRTAKALPRLIDFMKSNERRVCTLEKIVNDMNEGSTSVCVKN